jgi:NAD(P)H-quinone oxidoreductase subunit J
VAEENQTPETEETAVVPAGEVSSWLTENGFDHEILEPDHLGIELIKVDPQFLIPMATALYAYGFNYLQCQGAYDEGPGKELVSFYHLVKVSDNCDKPEEVRLKVFVPRD